jgi:hypothetical protein
MSTFPGPQCSVVSLSSHRWFCGFSTLGATRGIGVEFPALVVGIGMDSVAMLAWFLAFEVRTLAIASITVTV